MASSKLAFHSVAKRFASQIGPILLALFGGAALVWWMAGMPWKKELGRMAGFSLPGESISAPADKEAVAIVKGATVELSPEKIAEARVELTSAVKRKIRPETVVPGRVDFDTTKRLKIVAPVDCVVEHVPIAPGKLVKKGARLVILQSSDVGLARDQIGKCEDELKLAKRELDYAQDILKNVQALLEGLNKSPEYESVIQSFAGKRLGVHREHLLSAYSKLNLARKTMEESSDLGASGAVSGRLVQQRKSEKEIAAAAFDSQCETTLFECLQDKDRAEAATTRSERLLAIAKATLAALLGGLHIESPTADSTNLSELIVISPIDGQVESQVPVEFARLKAGDPLLTIADPTKLWITANVREREWNASRMKPGDFVTVKIPAIGKENIPAKLLFLGAEVSESTRTLPMVLEIDNPEGILRPGMSAWASLAIESEREALLIPATAVLRHEDQPFCFVSEASNRFRRVDLKLGQEIGEELEILEGLQGNEKVVIKGAFLLKSELLLEKEE